MADLNKAIQYRPWYADAYSVRGQVWSDQGNSKAAIADFSKAIELDPNKGVYPINLAREERLVGDLQKALADYKRGLELLPGDINGVTGLAETKRLLGDCASAVADFNRAMAMKPANWCDENWCRVHRGLAKAALGNFAAATDDFNTVLAIQPRYAEALFGRGVVRLKQGNKVAAQSDFDLAVAADAKLKSKVAEELKSAAGGPMTAGRATTTK
jgi:tetratricopeptide (TPR) repeat protein